MTLVKVAMEKVEVEVMATVMEVTVEMRGEMRE
jgi:hypothetical protein